MSVDKKIERLAEIETFEPRHKAPDDRSGRPAIRLTKLKPVGASKIPPRPWSYGNFLLSGHAAALGGVDGGGKGAMAVAIGAAYISGQPLLGERVWKGGPVCVVTYEDDNEEWHRRIAAACIHYGLDYETILSGFTFLERPGSRLCFAGTDAGKPIYPDGDDIIAAVREVRAKLLIIDPLNHAHGMDDGNNNVLIARVAGEIERMAVATGAATLCLHHLRKGNTGTVDDLMGATSLRATFRSTRILSRMTKDEGEKVGITRETWRYIRNAGSKENYAPPADRAVWFKLESVALNNGTDDYPAGDNLQVMTSWTPPSTFEDMDYTALANIFTKLRAGPGEGELYGTAKQGKRWAGTVIMAEAGKTERQAGLIVEGWVKNGVLIEGTYQSKAAGRGTKMVQPNDVKTAEILASLAPFGPPEQ